MSFTAWEIRCVTTEQAVVLQLQSLTGIKRRSTGTRHPGDQLHQFTRRLNLMTRIEEARNLILLRLKVSLSHRVTEIKSTRSRGISVTHLL